ncbi:MAG TPA: uroporphyrinogen decarboxylase [Gemmatimonadota bacterium]|nr:uroporphyrinogen decarboxylase [Gemmatimonadota bacterium]
MKDRFLRACRRETVDRTPVWFMRQAGRCLPEYRKIRERLSLLEIVQDPALCAEVTLQPVGRLGVDAAILFADITLPYAGMGIDYEIRPGVGPVVREPIRSPAAVARLRPFEPELHVAPLLEAIGLVRGASPVPLIGFAGGPFTLASYLVEGRPSRSFLAVKGFMHEHPGAWTELLGRLTDATIAYLGAQARAGAQALQVFDSWVGALAPLDYRDSVLPHARRLFAALPPGVPSIHFGTGTAGLLPLLAEAGGAVIGLDWRIDLARGWALVGDRGVQGNLDPAVAAGPWDALERHAREILDAAGGRPGHVFNLGHGVLPHTPPDNLRRLVDLVHETSSEMRGGEGAVRAG